MVILNTRKETVRLAAYRVVYAEAAILALRSFEGAELGDSFAAMGLARNLERAVGILKKVIDQFGKAPRQVSADGGFASRNNLDFAKGLEVRDAAFAKKRGFTVIEMAKSAWIYKMLRNFRAGIEAGISTLKRAFGLDRCTWSGWGGFKQYVWSSIVSYNLLVLARIRLAKA